MTESGRESVTNSGRDGVAASGHGSEPKSHELEPDWKLVAARIWGILVQRLTPQQIAALRRISHVHPTTRELARYLEVSETQAGNVTRQLYTEGFLHREKSGKSYRWFPAFPHPISLHYFDRSPIHLDGEAAERVSEILERRGR